jgi:hypothetical protein
MVPTADEGWFSDMSTLVSNQRWVFGAASLVFIFGLTAGIFLCRRAVARRRRAGQYNALPGEDLALGTLPRGGGISGRGRGPRTKELYDALVSRVRRMKMTRRMRLRAFVALDHRVWALRWASMRAFWMMRTLIHPGRHRRLRIAMSRRRVRCRLLAPVVVVVVVVVAAEMGAAGSMLLRRGSATGQDFWLLWALVD